MRTIKLDFRALLLGGVIALVFAGSAAYFFDIPFYLAIVGVLIAMFLNSFVAELEDNLPGGFNNPLPGGEEEYSARKRRLLPYRIAIWVVFFAIIAWLVYMGKVNGV